MWYYIVALINVYTNTQGLSTLFKKSAWNLVYPVNFWDTREIREILLVDLRDWKLKNTDFSREIKTLIGVYKLISRFPSLIERVV